MIGLALSGLILLITIPVNVVMAQDLAPQHAGLVSSMMQGFAWGIAGMIFIPLIGFLSDRFSMQTTMSALTPIPAASAPISSCQAAEFAPSSAIVPSTANPRPPPVIAAIAASAVSAERTDSGLATSMATDAWIL